MNTTELTYQIGDFQFKVNRNLLILNGIEQKIEQMQSDILMVFINKQSTIISRENLEKEIWGDRIVTEQSINNKISELRKLFNDDYRNPKYFKTHHKLGYELIATCDIVSKPSQELEKLEEPTTNIDEEAPPQLRTKFLWLLLFALITSVALASFLSIFIQQSYLSQPATTAYDFKPVTSDKGQEWAPSISKDGKYIVYSHRYNEKSYWQLHLKNYHTDEVIKLTFDDSDKYSPVWSPKTDTIYFIKNIQNKCTLWEMSDILTKPVSKQLLVCGDISSMSPISIDPKGQWLYFSDLDAQPKFRVARFNVISKVVEIITAPPNTGLGDYSLSLSPDGKNIAFLRAVTYLSSKLMVINLDTRESKVLESFNHTLFKIDWNTNEDILYIDESNNLSQLNIYTKNKTLIKTFQGNVLAPYKVASDRIFIVDGYFSDTDIFSIKLNGIKHEKKLPLVTSSFQDYEPIIAHTENKLSFTSNRTGVEQIWIKYNDQYKKMTSFTTPYNITNKQFSKDDKKILFLRDNELYLVDVKSTVVFGSLAPFKLIDNPIWSCDDKHALYIAKDNGIWSLYQTNIKSGAVDILIPNIATIKSDCDNDEYYAFLQNEEKLVKFDSTFSIKEEYSLSYYTNNGRDWQIANGHLYIHIDDSLKKINLETKKSEEILQLTYINGFYVKQNILYFTERTFKETHIKQLIKK